MVDRKRRWNFTLGVGDVLLMVVGCRLKVVGKGTD